MSGTRGWLIRAPVLAWLGWLLIRYWDDRSYLSIWHGINVAIHEAGHALFAPLGWLPGVAGGTILELLVPAIAGAMLYRQGDRFGVAVAVCWIGIVCFETATYAGDALALALPLVSPFGDPGAAGHDWANILSRYGALRHTHTVAAAWEWAGRLLMMAGLALGARVLWRMSRAGVGPERTAGEPYGGILTNYVITKTDRFEGAITGASEVFYRANYGHDHYQRHWVAELGLPWGETAENWDRISPFTYVENIVTPTLIMGGALDWNVPILNSEQLYQALKKLGRETVVVVYPGEHHGISRLSFQKDRWERYLDWYDKYVKGTLDRPRADWDGALERLGR